MHDLRFAFRIIRQNPAFSLTVVIILALCVGANTAVLSVVNAAMVAPLGYPQPERLESVAAIFRGSEIHNSHDGTTWELIRDRVPALDVACFDGGWTGVNLGVNGAGIYVKAQRVSTGFFRVLGIAPQIGREFNADEDRAGGPQAVILSDPAWHKYFNGDPMVIGRGILLRGEPYTVVGVMPARFRSITDADLWTPLRPSRTGEGGGSNYGIVARLKPGATAAQASAQLQALVPDLKKLGSYSKDAKVQLGIENLQQDLTSNLRRPLMILWAAVAAVFVLGCVNIGGMMLARASGRVEEIATRLALGAPTARIVRQLLVESMALGSIGGIAGIAAGWTALDALKKLGASTFDFLRGVDFDWQAVAAAVALTLLASVAFGLAPAWQASRVDLRSAQTGSRTVAGRSRFVSLGALAAGQVAITVPLLIGAGLLLHTFLYLWNLSPGFDPDHVVTARFSLADARYTAKKMNQYYDSVITRLREIPGIEGAAVSLNLPYERGLNDGFKLPGDTRFRITDLAYSTPDYFRVLHIPLMQGREFTAGDGAESARVAVVNLAFAARYFKDLAVLGKPIMMEDQQRLIVGVVGNIQQARAGWGNFGPVAEVPTVYVPAAQVSDGFLQMVHAWFSPNWIVRSSLPAEQAEAAIESVTRAADPLVPMAEFRMIGDLKLGALRFERFLATLADAVAALAASLAALGIYGLVANMVTERTKELGIRLALGSSRGEAIWTALRPALAWVCGGAAIGIGAALGLERFLRSFLWGVQTTDTITLLSVAISLIVATGVASFWPAARIVRLNPADTLRSQ